MERSPLRVAWDFLGLPEPPRGHGGSPAPCCTPAFVLRLWRSSWLQGQPPPLSRWDDGEHLPHGVMVRHRELGAQQVKGQASFCPSFLHRGQDPQLGDRAACRGLLSLEPLEEAQTLG